MSKRKQYRIKGRFATKEEYLVWKKLNKEAKEEKKFKPRKYGRPRNKLGRFIDDSKKPAIDIVRGRKSKKEQLRQEKEFDTQNLPTPDVTRKFVSEKHPAPVWRYEWRFEGLQGEIYADSLLRKLVSISVDATDMVTRVLISIGSRKDKEYMSSRTDVPQKSIQWLRAWHGRPSAILFEEKRTELFFDVVVMTRSDLRENWK